MKSFLLFISLSFLATVHSAEIIWVVQAEGEAGQEYVEMLRTEGHDVEVMVVAGEPPTADQLATMNASDLVVVSRKVNSGDGAYNTFVWNDSVTVPLIAQTPYILRTNDTERWQWVAGTGLADSIPSTILAEDPMHKIFEGIPLTDNIAEPWQFERDRNLSVSTDELAGGGKVIARKTADPDSAIIAAEWETDQVAVGPRMMFMLGAREPAMNDGPSSFGAFNSTELGQIAFLNSISYYAGPWGAKQLWAPTEKELGSVDSAPGGQEISIYVKNLGLDEAVSLSNLSFAGAGKDFYSVVSSPATLGPTEVAQIVISLDTNGSTGSFDAELVIENDSTLEPLRQRTIALKARAFNFAGPAAHYTLDSVGEEGAVLDVTGYDRNGVAEEEGVAFDAASLVGGDGGGATFSGGQVTADLTTVGPLTDFSVSLWLQAAPDVVGLQTIFASDDGGAPSFGLLLDAGNLQWFVTDQAYFNTTDVPITANTAYHLVAVYEETEAETLTLYLNGEELVKQSDLEPFDGLAENPFLIGSFNDVFSFDGVLDDVQIYDRVLTAEEVTGMFSDPGSFPVGGPPTVDPPTGDNILVNGSFEEPAVGNINTNNLGTVPTGWSQTGADETWNLIRNDGTPYDNGVDTAAEGSQVIDLNGEFEIFQNFTLAADSEVSFGASFANRSGHEGDPSTVGIYDAAGDTLLSPEVSVDTSAEPQPSEVWASGQATVSLAAGEYRIIVDLNNWNNVDAVFVSIEQAAGEWALVDDLSAVDEGPLDGVGGWVSTDPGTQIGLVDGDKVIVSEGAAQNAYVSLGGSIPTGSTGTVFFRARASELPDFVLGVSDVAAPGAWDDYEGYMRFAAANIDVRDGGGFANVLENFSVETWYNIWLVLDNDTLQTTLHYSTGTEAAQLGGSGAFRMTDGNTEHGDIITFLVRTGNAHTTGQVDNIYLNASGENLTIPQPVLDALGGGTGEGAPEITGVSRSATAVGLALPDGTTYDIQYSPDLITWETIASDVTGSFEDTDAARLGAGNGYYRGVVK